MVSWMEEYSSAVALVIDAHRALRARNPEHELLSLVELSDDRREFVWKSGAEQRCLPEGFDGEHANMHAMGHYFCALEMAVGGKSY
ncbi:MAG: hypothetical protein ABIH92_01800, partial [Nanoarchaeota archaeon]